MLPLLLPEYLLCKETDVSFGRILIAIDGSRLSFDAARTGFDLASQLSAQAATLFVVEPAVPCSGDIGVPPDEAVELVVEADDAVCDKLRQAVRLPDEAPHFVHAGHPPDVILHYAKDWSADLIVVGSHGRSGMSRVILGSVAEAVVRHAPCPVLVVRKAT